MSALYQLRWDFSLSTNSKSALARLSVFRVFFLARVTFGISIFSFRATYNLKLQPLAAKSAVHDQPKPSFLNLLSR
jgi:hypothetical protein